LRLAEALGSIMPRTATTAWFGMGGYPEGVTSGDLPGYQGSSEHVGPVCAMVPAESLPLLACVPHVIWMTSCTHVDHR
jgi:hypothetical protein